MITFSIITFLAVAVAALVFRLEYLSYVTVQGLQDQIHNAEAYAKDATTLAQIVDGRIETFQTATIQRIVSLEKVIEDISALGCDASGNTREIAERLVALEGKLNRLAVRLHMAGDDCGSHPAAPLQYGGNE